MSSSVRPVAKSMACDAPRCLCCVRIELYLFRVLGGGGGYGGEGEEETTEFKGRTPERRERDERNGREEEAKENEEGEEQGWRDTKDETGEVKARARKRWRKGLMMMM